MFSWQLKRMADTGVERSKAVATMSRLHSSIIHRSNVRLIRSWREIDRESNQVTQSAMKLTWEAVKTLFRNSLRFNLHGHNVEIFLSGTRIDFYCSLSDLITFKVTNIHFDCVCIQIHPIVGVNDMCLISLISK